MSEGNSISLVYNFLNSWKKDKQYAIETLMHQRNPINGLGKKMDSIIKMFIIKLIDEDAYKNLLPSYINEGCWKDVLILHEMSVNLCNYVNPDIEVRTIAYALIIDKMNYEKGQKISMCAKWAPSERCYFDKKTGITRSIAKFMKINLRDYRLLLTKLRKRLDIIETKLSSKLDNEIEVFKIPMVAKRIYKNALIRCVNSRGEYLESRKMFNSKFLKFIIIDEKISDPYFYNVIYKLINKSVYNLK